MINLNEPYDVYIATEIRQISNGGVSKWVDDWINNVAPHLVVRPVLIIEIEQDEFWEEYALQFITPLHRPGSEWEFEYSYRSLPIPNYFSLPDRRTVDMLIKGARKFHIMSYPIPIMMIGNQNKLTPKQMRDTYDREIDSLCVHSREKETLKVQRKLMKFTKQDLKYQDVSIDFQELLIKDSKETIWIGTEDEEGFDYIVSNCYKFEHNLPATDSNVVGFPARCEARKNLQFLQNLDSIIFTKEAAMLSYLSKVKTKFKLPKTKLEEYRVEKIHDFYMSNEWGISHSCFENEPFGYSIFQSIDYGKLPIISKDWCKEMDYPFRASTRIQFEKEVANISKLSLNERNNYLGKLRDYLSKYSSVEKWRNDLLSVYNKDGDNVWLPGSLSPSRDV